MDAHRKGTMDALDPGPGVQDRHHDRTRNRHGLQRKKSRGKDKIPLGYTIMNHIYSEYSVTSLIDLEYKMR